jgi:hypothetical protein
MCQPDKTEGGELYLRPCGVLCGVLVLIFFRLGVDIVALSSRFVRVTSNPAAKSAPGLCSTCAAERIRGRSSSLHFCFLFFPSEMGEEARERSLPRLTTSHRGQPTRSWYCNVYYSLTDLSKAYDSFLVTKSPKKPVRKTCTIKCMPGCSRSSAQKKQKEKREENREQMQRIRDAACVRGVALSGM